MLLGSMTDNIHRTAMGIFGGYNMINIENIMSLDKDQLQEESQRLNENDIAPLVELLSSKDDNIRYQVFLLLQNRSVLMDDVYPHWDTFRNKLTSGNSYQRSIGMMLIAQNARWDTENKMKDTIDGCLQLLMDDKPITIRQSIRSLGKIAVSKPSLNGLIASRLISIDLVAIKETMRKSILLDIMNVIFEIRKEYKSDEMENFILNALSGAVLDKKSKKQFIALL